ncbi:MAG: PstS family phosphate ABC transporter substrate-binding protein [Nitrospiraceae bacterium]
MMRGSYYLLALALGATVFCTGPSQAMAQLKPDLDPKIPDYIPVSGVEGRLSILGSETMKPLTELWASELKRLYSGLTIDVQGQGSQTGLRALLEGKANVAAMSRRMTAQEIGDFMNQYGYEPTEVPVATDALAVFVHRDNPITGISLPELDAVFSLERRRGHKSIERWGQLGLNGDWATASVTLYGRDELSGTAVFFREHVSQGADFKPSLKKSAGAASTIVDVMKDRFGIGFSGIGYRTSTVKPVPLAGVKGGRFVEPTFQTVMDGSYPLRRTLYFYVNKQPKVPIPPAVAEFVKYALSAQGQEVVLKQGYFPLSTVELARHAAQWSASLKAASTGSTILRD